MYRPKVKPLKILMIAFGFFLVMRIAIARYSLDEIEDGVAGEITERTGISIQLTTFPSF